MADEAMEIDGASSAPTSNHNVYYTQPESFKPQGTYYDTNLQYVSDTFSLQLTRHPKTTFEKFRSKFIFEGQSGTHGPIKEEVWLRRR
jgi:hypothetical protein